VTTQQDLEARARLAHFRELDRPGKALAIRRLAHEGWSPRTVSAATGQCVETVLVVLKQGANFL
jgi:hypothetical protein